MPGGSAIATGAATTVTVSVINNDGNLGTVFKDVTSSDALKRYAIAGLTAGMTVDYFNDWTGITTDPGTGKISTNLGTWKGVGQFAASQGLQNGTSAALGKIMGQGGDLGDALQSTLFNTLAAASFNAVGDYTKDVYTDGSLQKIMIHAMVGGLLAEVSGGDFKTGALAAGANEALVDQLDTWVDGDKNLLNMTSQLVGMLAAATQSDADAESLQTGAWVAQNATQYNFFDHLPPGMSEYGHAATSLAEYMQGQGATAEDITQAQLALAQGQGFDGVQPANEFVKAWGIFMAGELAGIGVVAAIGAKGIARDQLISGLPAGTKITPGNVVDIRKLPDGRTVWLENGSDAAGLQHIYKRHEVDFVNKGVSRDEIPAIVMNALERGKIVGTNGSANVYRITHNGVQQNIAIGVGSNGFVIRANPVSSWKPLP